MSRWVCPCVFPHQPLLRFEGSIICPPIFFEPLLLNSVMAAVWNMNTENVEHIKGFALSLFLYLTSSASLMCARMSVCMQMCACVCLRTDNPRGGLLPLGFRSDQSRVCQFAGTQTASLYTLCTEQRGRERVGERHQHRAGERGLGRAAKIRKHHAVLNRGYVEVRKPQWALLLTRIPIQEQPKGTELKSGLCQQGQTVAWLKKTRLSHLSLKNYPEVCSWRGVQPVMVVRFTAAWYILFEVNLALIQYCQETYQCPGWLSEEKWSISFTRAFLKLAQKEYQK